MLQMKIRRVFSFWNKTFNEENTLQIMESETTEEMRDILDEKDEIQFQLGVDTPTCMLSLRNKQELTDDVCLAFTIHRTTAVIHQLWMALKF